VQGPAHAAGCRGDLSMDYLPARILLATDGSPDATLPLRAAVDLSAEAGWELHVVHAWQAFPSYPHPSIAMATDVCYYEQEAQKILFDQLDRIEEIGGVTAGAHLRRGRPAETITAVAEELGAGLVVVGSRGLGPVKRLVMGSVSEGVVDLASRPVLVVRGGEEAWPPSCVIVGDDSSRSSKRAGELAVSIGALLGARVLLVRAHPTFPGISPVAAAAEKPLTLEATLCWHEVALMGRARRMEERTGVYPRVKVCVGEAAQVLLEAAEESGGPCLIAVGRRGLGFVDRLRLGSISTKVLRAATGPILVCPS
jgi:nucleotide-binding universal stress UspA family protein